MEQAYLNWQILVGLHFKYSGIVHIWAADMLQRYLLMYFLNFAQVYVFLPLKNFTSLT